MKRAFVPLLNSLLITAFALTSSIGHAQDQAPAAGSSTAAKIDPAKGGTLYAEGDAARGLPACVSCHGANGNSTIAVNPRLAAQSQSYLYKQLVNFTTDARQQPVMSLYAKMLTDADKHNVAAWLSTQTAKPGAAKNRASLELGKKIYRGGIAEKNVPACASCHGATGGGIPALYPRLAGQHQDYTVAQLGLFKGHGRKNSPEMATIAARMSDDEMKAVADYVAGLK
ncbi:cytochrome C [Duganella sp. Leaf126]|uniref:c-type cytochrome n=1 Tax=Duganella sp. Leaf126 TaxID=1736266 RepID=UPI0006F6CF8B|nr:c-type cytochrome [Duganella sp. Leaf126]KQQ47634.1 cytochrome C [Duganella sp. Leaf126]